MANRHFVQELELGKTDKDKGGHGLERVTVSTKIKQPNCLGKKASSAIERPYFKDIMLKSNNQIASNLNC